MEQIGLETSSDVVDEIWAAICYFADVPDAGKELLKSRGIAPDRLEDAYTSLQSFLRQGRAFFAAARGASGRSSPLIYYYSFLNLVKALICLKWPDRVRERIPHGLSHQLKDGALEIQTISVTDQGVFHLLYELLLDEKVPSGLMFDVFSLLTYCGDIATEVVWVKNGRMRTLHGKSRIQVNGDEIYATLGVLNFENFEDCPSAKERFYKTFEEVDLGKDQKRSEFSLFAEETTGWRFFETIDTAKGPDRNLAYKKIYTQCCDARRPFLLEHPYQTDRCEFNLCRPLGDSSPILFNEILGIYTTIFFLSSLVRYYPRYFEAALVTKDVWMVEAFIRSAPVTLLRYLANRIFGQNRQYRAR